MSTRKFSRLITLITVFVVALLAAACSPSATTPTSAPGGDTNATSVPSTSGETTDAGDPAAAAKDFFDALLTGGDAAAFVCTTATDAQAVQDAYKQLAAAYAAAKIDTAGLTYTASDITADAAKVAVGGNLSIDTSGVKTNVPFEIPSVPMKNESGTWKICA